MSLGISHGLHVPRLNVADAGAGSSFQPSSLFTGQYGYAFDPKDLTKVFQDSAGTTAGVVGQPVGLLKDISGNGKDFSQPTTAARPTLQSDGFSTDGAATYLVRSEAGLYAAGSATVVMRVQGASGQLGMRIWAEGSGSSNNPIYQPGTGTDSVSSNHLGYFIRDNAITVDLQASATGTVFDGTWHTVAITDTGSAIDLYIDGAHIEQKTYTRTTSTFDHGALGCLYRGAASSFFAGRIGRVIAIGRVLNSTELSNATTWVGS